MIGRSAVGRQLAQDLKAVVVAADRVGAVAVGGDEELDTATNRNRVESFRSAVDTVPDATAHVVPIPTRRFESRTSPWQLEEAYRAVSALVESGVPADAMLFEDDYHSLGALRALAERGVRVPEDVMVIGYSDHPYAAYLQPSLTSVSVPFGLIAEAAVSLLLRRIAGDRTPPVRRLLPAELIVRESSVRQLAEPAPAP